ncbi:MAG: nitrilase-related carbon-nitrogen hydrolase, partial [Alphaproteobacteria bacterium]
MTFKVACVQMAAGREFAPNIEKLSALIQLARKGGDDLITLPEAITMIEPVAEKALAKALPEDRHPGLEALRKSARETGAWILIGSLNIRHERGKVANRSFLLDSDGAIVARYDKIHL